MPSTTIPRKASSPGSDSDSEVDRQITNPAASASGSDEESDYLDDSGSRKRRKLIPQKVFAKGVVSRVGTSQAPKPSRAPELDGAASSTDIQPIGVTAPVDPDTTFDSLGVRPWLVQSLANLAIKRPTGIQKRTIPQILSGRDCIGGSRTGSGKTMAFLVPILQIWAADPSAFFAVVLTPTRELALQIFEQLKAISAPQSLKAILVTGGADMMPQAIALGRRPHMIVATPGRLADHIRSSGEDTVGGLKRARFVVLDEADRLLSQGPGSMMPDVEECLGALPPSSKRQTLLFTATVTEEVDSLKNMPPKPGKGPIFVCEVDTQSLAIPSTLAQSHLQINVTHKDYYLHMLLLTPRNENRAIILFCNTTSQADMLHRLLKLLGHRVAALHSKLPQRERTNNLGRFRAAAARVLVATDVAARGLDIPEVALVINYDVPRDPVDYIHRVGRTARAGRKGEAVTIVGQRDVELVQAIEERVGRPLEKWEEEGVNLETRLLRELKIVGEKKREAELEIEEDREVGGKRKRTMKKLRVKD